MKRIAAVLLLITVACFAWGQSKKFCVSIPSPESESLYIWQNIMNIHFFDRNGYSISLPKCKLVSDIVDDTRKGSVSDDLRDSLQKVMAQTIYSKADYQRGFDKICSAMPTIEKAQRTLSKTHWEWDIRLFNCYTINLTLYGPGGSYNPQMGSILLMTTPDGRFKGYDQPEYTIIHEMVHISIDSSIIQKHHLAHTTKERIVDLFVHTFFSDLLPNYRIQTFGDSRIDKYLTSKRDFINLEERVELFLKELPKDADRSTSPKKE